MTLPAGWVEAAAEDVCGLVQSGGTPKNGFLERAGIPFLKVYNLVNQQVAFSYKPQWVSVEVHQSELAKSRAVPGDVLMNIVGPPLGKVAIVPADAPEWNFNQAIAMFRPSEAATSRWLYWYLCGGSSVQSIINATRGIAGQVNISLSQCRAFTIPIPPKAEQRRIVAKLDALTARLARARAELDRVPVLAANLRLAALREAYDGAAAHRVLALGDLIETLDQGWSPKCENYPSSSGDEWAVLKTTAVQAITYRSGENKVLPSDLAPRPSIEVRPGDVLVTRAGPRVRCGVTCLVETTRPRLMLADKMYRLRCKEHVNPAFLTFMLNSPQALERIEVMKTGISDSGLNLTQSKFLALELPAPSSEVQNELVAVLRTAFARAGRMEAEATRARALIDRLEASILGRAFRGELVPQDPNDEPASVPLDRIRAERAAAPRQKRGRRAKAG